jgi:hypothetical protein
MTKGSLRSLSLALVFTIIGGLTFNIAYAEISVDPTGYQLQNTSAGFDVLTNSSSPNYQGTSSSGGTIVGDSASTSFQASAGATTTSDPTLSFAVTSSSSNFGTFSPTAATTTTSTFTVLNYTSYGYVVQIFGTSPTYGAHTITALASPTASIAGTEQFGMNLVANTSPTTFGSDPVHGLFAVGSAYTGYSTTNQYKYVSGDIIASAPKSSGQTSYTISYIINTSSVTPSGPYISNQSIVCTGTY